MAFFRNRQQCIAGTEIACKEVSGSLFTGAGIVPFGKLRIFANKLRET
jgi:hypothetical protein